MPYPEIPPVEPTAAGRPELERGLLRLSCRTANGRVRVDALEWLKSPCCGVELHEFSFAVEEDTRNVEQIRIYG